MFLIAENKEFLLTQAKICVIIYCVNGEETKAVCGRGGIGRRSGFRFRRETVQVQVLSPVPKHGGIAQLGERLNGIQEVMGSIPTISTNKKTSL